MGERRVCTGSASALNKMGIIEEFEEEFGILTAEITVKIGKLAKLDDGMCDDSYYFYINELIYRWRSKQKSEKRFHR